MNVPPIRPHKISWHWRLLQCSAVRHGKLWRTDHIAIVKQLRVASAASLAPHGCQAVKPHLRLFAWSAAFCGCIFFCTPSCSLWSLSRSHSACRGHPILRPLVETVLFSVCSWHSSGERHPDSRDKPRMFQPFLDTIFLLNYLSILWMQ